MQRAGEIALILIILVGAAFLYRSTLLRSQLTREHERLADKVGKLPIKDPTKIHLLAIRTSDPRYFAWRAYFPPNHNYAYTCMSGGGSGSLGSSPWEGILRVGIREDNGRLFVYDRLPQGSGLRSLHSRELAAMFKENPRLWEQLQAEQLAKDKLVIFDPSEVKTLIRLSLSEELLREAKERMTETEYREVSPQLEKVRIGPQGFEEHERAGSGE